MMGPAKLCIAWLGGWAGSLACWQSDIRRLYPGYRHAFFDSLDHLNKPHFLETLAPQGAGPTVIAAWSLGSLLVHSRLASTAAMPAGITKIVSICPVLAFCCFPGGWPKRIVERMKSQLESNSSLVLSNFFTRMAEGARLNESQITAWKNQSALYSQNTKRLQAGLDYLMNTEINLECLLPHGKKLVFLWSRKDPVSPSADYLESADFKQVCVPEGHLPFITRPDAFRKALSL